MFRIFKKGGLKDVDSRLKIILDNAPNKVIFDSFLKTYNILNSRGYKNVMVGISGGADSDLVLDICTKLDFKNVCRYVWFDTGLEYEATKKHINFLEEWYGIEIEKVRPKKNIIKSCREHGQPFISKMVSGYIFSLQRHNFDFNEKLSFEEELKKYKYINSTIRWWENAYYREEKGQKKRSNAFCIKRNKYLKEFMIDNNPWFKISDKCCKYAKKNASRQYRKKNKIDLYILGIRKTEGGARSKTYKSCFLERADGEVLFMPIFWYKSEDKKKYCEYYDIIHSDCYERYGFKRTGCAGCPFGGIKNVNEELKAIKKYEPNLYKACKNIFGDSYRYMRMYKDYRDMMDGKPLDKLAEGVEREDIWISGQS